MSITLHIFAISVEYALALFYLSCITFLMFPYCPGSENYNFILRLFRNSFVPGTLISFPEILFADILTSLSKVMRDFGMTLIVLYTRVIGADMVAFHDFGILILALLSSIPFVYVRMLLLYYLSSYNFPHDVVEFEFVNAPSSCPILEMTPKWLSCSISSSTAPPSRPSF